MKEETSKYSRRLWWIGGTAVALFMLIVWPTPFRRDSYIETSTSYATPVLGTEFDTRTEPEIYSRYRAFNRLTGKEVPENCVFWRPSCW